jgi:hypothetical protein
MKRCKQLKEIYPHTPFEPTFKHWKIPQVISKDSTPMLITKDEQQLKIEDIYISFDKPNPITYIICYDSSHHKIVMEIKEFKRKYFE